MKIYSNVAVSSGPGEKKKKKEETPTSKVEKSSVTVKIGGSDKKYEDFKKKDKAGRGHEGAVGFKKTEQFSSTASPRVGGKVTPSSGMASGTSSKKLLKKSRQNVNKSSASAAAKKSARKLY